MQTRYPRLKSNEKPRMANPIFLIGTNPKLCKKKLTCLTAPVKGTLEKTFREMLRNLFVTVNNLYLFKFLKPFSD